MNYIEELESYLHENFLNSESNLSSKKYDTVAYVRMLESTVKALGHDVPKREYHFTIPHVLVDDYDGNEVKFLIEEDCGDYYKIRYFDVVTIASKNKITIDSNNNMKYNQKLRIPKGSSRNGLTYLYATGNIDSFEEEEER